MPRHKSREVQSAPVTILNVLVMLVMLPIRLMIWFFVVVLMALLSLE